MAGLLLPVFMVHQAMIAAGVNDTVNLNVQSLAVCLAKDIFDNNFVLCMDKSQADVEADFKSFSSLTKLQGQIRILPRVKKRIMAFTRWTRDDIRLGQDPSLRPYLVIDTTNLTRRYNTHSLFIKKSNTLSDATKPVMLTKEVK